MSNTWTYKDESWGSGVDLVGYDVQATDGSIGKVSKDTREAGDANVVVDTGFWIFGKKRMIPAGAVTHVDTQNETIQVNLTKDQVKDAPDYDEVEWGDQSRTRHEEYYGPYSW